MMLIPVGQIVSFRLPVTGVGNVYDFYFRVYNKLIQDIKVPFKMDGAFGG